MTTEAVMDRKTMSTAAAWKVSVSASGVLIVGFGSITATYANGGSIAVPLAFLLVTVVLSVQMVGYTAMARRVPHAAVYYAACARALSRPVGVGAGMAALVGYSAIENCLYGFVGWYASGLFGGSWWAYALLFWLLAAASVMLPVAFVSKLLGGVLVISAVVIALLVVAGLTHPANGQITFDGFHWSALSDSDRGKTLILCLAALVGLESAGNFGEEAQHSKVTSRAPHWSVLTLGPGYALVAWAVQVANGPDKVVAAASDPQVGVPFNTITEVYGILPGILCQLMLLFGILATMLPLRAIFARYSLKMADEQVLPRRIAFVPQRGGWAGGPVGGWLLQSAISLAVIVVFAVFGLDPLTQLFSWLATIGALAFVGLLALCSLAAMFYRHAGRDRWWRRPWAAPFAGVLLGGLLLAVMLANTRTMLGVAPGVWSPSLVVVPAVLVAAFVVGLVRAGYLAVAHRDVYDRISYSVGDPLAKPSRPMSQLAM